MTTRFLSEALSPRSDAFEEIYTMPADASGIALDVTGASTSGIAATFSVAVKRAVGGVVTLVSAGINVASGASSKLIPGKVALAPGDKVMALNSAALLDQNWPGSPLAGTPNGMFANADGSIIIASLGANGLWRSTDGGATYTKVSTLDTSALIAGIFTGGTFHLFSSNRTTKWTSTDAGVTWTAVAITNGPDRAFDNRGSIINRGGVFVGQAGANQLVSSADLITWANLGVAASGNFNLLVWTGANFVANNTAANDRVQRTDGTAGAWTQIVMPGAYGIIVSSVCNIGTTILAMPNGSSPSYWRSVDGGATFASGTGPSGYVVSAIGTPGGFFVRSQYGAAYSPTGLDGTWLSPGYQGALLQSLPATGAYAALTPTKLIGYNGVLPSFDGKRRGGGSVTVSAMEVTNA